MLRGIRVRVLLVSRPRPRNTRRALTRDGGVKPVLADARRGRFATISALFLHTVIAGHSNELLTEQLFGVPLGASFIVLLGDGGMTFATVTVFGVLVAAIVAVAEITRRALRPQPVTEPSAVGSAGLLRLVGLLQFATAVVAIFVPLAAGLYLLVTVA